MTEAEASHAVNALYESWYSAAMRYARTLTALVDVAEDSVQEAFLSLYRELRRGGTVDNPRAWALKAIRVQIRVRMGVIRDEESKRGSIASAEDIPDAGPWDLAHDDVRDLCAVLTEREREVIFLRLTEMKYREIAMELGISASSVNTLLARALRKLQRASGRPGSIEVHAHIDDEDNVPQTLQ